MRAAQYQDYTSSSTSDNTNDSKQPAPTGPSTVAVHHCQPNTQHLKLVEVPRISVPEKATEIQDSVQPKFLNLY